MNTEDTDRRDKGVMDKNPPPPPPPPPASSGLSRTLSDMNIDSLDHCARFLSLRELSSLALTCKALRRFAYSDHLWHRLYTEHWPYTKPPSCSGVRAAYIARHADLQQLKFIDPLVVYVSETPLPHSHILLHKNDIFLAQGSTVYASKHASSRSRRGSLDALLSSCRSLFAHNARITCMRAFPIVETPFFRSEIQSEDTLLITSSSDRTVRICWKDHSHRCFRGHNGPVTTLADKLLGDSGLKVLASGGEDCTVRLWSVSGKPCPLTMTFHGHEKPISLLSVARHKSSLLVSISKDSRVRVWDTMAASQSTSVSCVGKTCLLGPPVGMKCEGSLCYIAAGSSVSAIDLRTMQKVSTVAVHVPKIYSFEMLPSKWSICTGGEDKAMLWDIRKSHEQPEPVAELDACSGRITMLHMDPYKIVTGGPFDHRVNVWETETVILANSLDCRPLGETENLVSLSAMAVEGCRIVTSGCAEEPGVLCYRDFSNCSVEISPPGNKPGSKFWASRSSQAGA